MDKQKIKAFTLVELIVVITILAILGTIAFISFQGYSSKARDSVRTSELRNIQKGIELYQVKTGKYPMPDNYISITDGSIDYIYQGNVGKRVTSIIGGSSNFKDPLDETLYTYSINYDNNKYQLTGFYENEFLEGFLKNTYANLEKRTPKSFGNSIGLLLNTNGLSIEQDTGIQSTKTLNIFDGSNEDKYSFVGNKKEQKISKIGTSCKNILDNDSSLLNQDGVYTIMSKNGLIQAYCDMTTDGGGWTILAKTGKQIIPTIESECNADISITNLETENNDYLVHCDLGQTEFLVNQPGDGYVVGTSFSDGDPEDLYDFKNCALNATKTGINKCFWYTHPKKTFKLIKETVGISANHYWIWKEGDYKEFVHDMSYNIYDFFESGGLSLAGIGNRGKTGSYRDKTGRYTNNPEGKFGYIGVR